MTTQLSLFDAPQAPPAAPKAHGPFTIDLAQSDAPPWLVIGARVSARDSHSPSQRTRPGTVIGFYGVAPLVRVLIDSGLTGNFAYTELEPLREPAPAEVPAPQGVRVRIRDTAAAFAGQLGSTQAHAAELADPKRLLCVHLDGVKAPAMFHARHLEPVT